MVNIDGDLSYMLIWLVEFRLFCIKRFIFSYFSNHFYFFKIAKDTLIHSSAPIKF
jgi:hypothetical protein